MGEFEDMWLVFSRIMDPGDFSPRIKFKWLLRNEPTDVRRADDINQLEKEAVQVSIPKWAAESDINLGRYSFSLEALHACATQYKTISALFMKEIWPSVMEDLKSTRALKREQITRDHIYCIIDQRSAATKIKDMTLLGFIRNFRSMVNFSHDSKLAKDSFYQHCQKMFDDFKLDHPEQFPKGDKVAD